MTILKNVIEKQRKRGQKAPWTKKALDTRPDQHRRIPWLAIPQDRNSAVDPLLPADVQVLLRLRSLQLALLQ